MAGIECPDTIQIPNPPLTAFYFWIYVDIGDPGIFNVDWELYDYLDTAIWGPEPMDNLGGGWYRVLYSVNFGSINVGYYYIKITAVGATTKVFYKSIFMDGTFFLSIFNNGLSHSNVAVENTFSGEDHTTSNIYHYDTPAHALLNDHLTGLIASYQLTVTYVGGKPTKYTMVKTI